MPGPQNPNVWLQDCQDVWQLSVTDAAIVLPRVELARDLLSLSVDLPDAEYCSRSNCNKMAISDNPPASSIRSYHVIKSRIPVVVALCHATS